jgi:hypothetical protein
VTISPYPLRVKAVDEYEKVSNDLRDNISLPLEGEGRVRG